ncbi:hypothetical protein Hte_006266 [Hypoxylon texense]
MASRSSTKKQKSRPERIERTDAFIRKLLKLYTKQNAYFSIQELLARNVICGSLDFETGEPNDGWGRFFEPVSMKSMRDMLQAKNPGAVCYSGTVSPDRDNWYNANTLWPHLEMWLYTAEDDSAPGVMDEAGWYIMDTSPFKMLRRQVGDVHWTLEAMLEHKDISNPHLIAVLSDKQPLKEDSISLSELMVIICMIMFRISGSAYEQYRVIPVTVLSCSGLPVRIVQGFIDPDAGKLIIRKTPIMTRTVEPKDCWDLHVNLLRWLTATPVGETK